MKQITLRQTTGKRQGKEEEEEVYHRSMPTALDKYPCLEQ